MRGAIVGDHAVGGRAERERISTSISGRDVAAQAVTPSSGSIRRDRRDDLGALPGRRPGAATGRAEVENHVARRKQLERSIQLEELVGGAGRYSSRVPRRRSGRAMLRRQPITGRSTRERPGREHAPTLEASSPASRARRTAQVADEVPRMVADAAPLGVRRNRSARREHAAEAQSGGRDLAKRTPRRQAAAARGRVPCATSSGAPRRPRAAGFMESSRTPADRAGVGRTRGVWRAQQGGVRRRRGDTRAAARERERGETCVAAENEQVGAAGEVGEPDPCAACPGRNRCGGTACTTRGSGRSSGW